MHVQDYDGWMDMLTEVSTSDGTMKNYFAFFIPTVDIGIGI